MQVNLILRSNSAVKKSNVSGGGVCVREREREERGDSGNENIRKCED